MPKDFHGPFRRHHRGATAAFPDLSGQSAAIAMSKFIDWRPFPKAAANGGPGICANDPRLAGLPDRGVVPVNGRSILLF
jgi:hypothetical protein